VFYFVSCVGRLLILFLLFGLVVFFCFLFVWVMVFSLTRVVQEGKRFLGRGWRRRGEDIEVTISSPDFKGHRAISEHEVYVSALEYSGWGKNSDVGCLVASYTRQVSRQLSLWMRGAVRACPSGSRG